MPKHMDHVPTIADAEYDFFEDDGPSVEAVGVSSLLLWIFAVAALVLLPVATHPGRRDLGWYMEPFSWPLIALSVALIGGAVLPFRLVRLRQNPGFGNRVSEAFKGMDRALLYSGMFLVYLFGISWLGFTISSAIFMQALYWVSGLRGGYWPWIALAVTAAIVLAFRVGLDIWFPIPPLLELLPEQISNTFGAYL